MHAKVIKLFSENILQIDTSEFYFNVFCGRGEELFWGAVMRTR
jgi:hypothetical protein